VTDYQNVRERVQLTSRTGQVLGHHVSYLGVFGNFLDHIDFLLGLAAQFLELHSARDQTGKLLSKNVLVEMVTEYTSVKDVDAVIVQVNCASVIVIYVARNDNKENKEGCEKHGDVILFLEEYARQSNTYVVGAGSIRVAILFEVFSGFFIS